VALLGRSYTIAGVVQSGDRRGRTIGFPTANLTSLREALPKIGVYATTTRIEDEARRRASVTNIGLRPTVADGTAGIRIETHVMDFAGELYDRPIEVAFHARLRDEMRFPSLAELRAQIARDVASARSALALP
jgi:riboflavin kinase/FMN adenylyltransferase